MAVAAGPELGDHAVLVVCDGVSSSTDSDVASLAAARAARDVLTGAPGIRSTDSVRHPGGGEHQGARGGDATRPTTR